MSYHSTSSPGTSPSWWSGPTRTVSTAQEATMRLCEDVVSGWGKAIREQRDHLENHAEPVWAAGQLAPSDGLSGGDDA